MGLLALALLVGAAAGARTPALPAHEVVSVRSPGDGDAGRLVLEVETPEPLDAEGAVVIARHLVERWRSARFRVVETEYRLASSGPDAPPYASVTWAPADLAQRDAWEEVKEGGDFSLHEFRLHAAGDAESPLLLERTPPVWRGGEGAAPPPLPRRGRPPAPAPLPWEARAEARPALPEEEIRAFLRSWQLAWRRRDLEGYLAHYSQRFRVGSLDLSSWAEHKRRVFSSAGEIVIAIEGVEVELRGGTPVVRFRQTYRSDALLDRGRKTLVLERAEGRLRILREEWEPGDGGSSGAGAAPAAASRRSALL